MSDTSIKWLSLKCYILRLYLVWGGDEHGGLVLFIWEGCWLVGSFGFLSGGELLVPMRMAMWGRISYGMNYSHSLQCLGKPTVLSPIFLQDDLSYDVLVALHFFGFLFDYDYLKENYCQKLIQPGRPHKIYSR